MILLDVESIQNHLISLNYKCYIQKQTGQICVDLPFLDATLPLFIRIYETADLLQLMLILPINFTKEELPGISRLLHLLNKEIDLPGFGLDEEIQIAFYRITLPAFEHKIHCKLIHTMLLSIENIVKQTIPVIAKIAAGELNLEDLFEQAKKFNTPAEVSA